MVYTYNQEIFKHVSRFCTYFYFIIMLYCTNSKLIRLKVIESLLGRIIKLQKLIKFLDDKQKCMNLARFFFIIAK